MKKIYIVVGIAICIATQAAGLYVLIRFGW